MRISTGAFEFFSFQRSHEEEKILIQMQLEPENNLSILIYSPNNITFHVVICTYYEIYVTNDFIIFQSESIFTSTYIATHLKHH